ncbi:YwqJ-related putative deaminase [Streptomyces caniferus]|uniref:YwqJ-related putative deaminase n=1 Tax=Streptomyces caniferus TaxID=285557 RepID=UPI002E2AA8E4|nr:YwqJ-related putative deaminase [Streptomyces caniferus]
MVLSQTNLAGAGKPNLHPAVDRFFRFLPAQFREPFMGYCAESALVSDQLWHLDEQRPEESPTTLESSASHFADAVILSRLIREPGDPDHGKPTLPCRSCTALLDELGVRIMGRD